MAYCGYYIELQNSMGACVFVPILLLINAGAIFVFGESPAATVIYFGSAISLAVIYGKLKLSEPGP